ncbi:MAG: 1-phosphofructokinase family hexose kinase [Cytophagaceae bacterium]|nr:1-phosphofructokinase family hexose kinase [Cytophagaceae bacterium]MDW8456391.1 1-phosphofructokinase family hexose kinase [Cytophagaceae bacterium]
MKKILTVTFSPALDKSTSVENIVPDHKLRCTEPVFEPGGGGINVSRALKKLGCDSIAIYAKGGYTGTMLKQLLDEEEIIQHPINTQRPTRENFIVVENATNLQYRYGMPSPELSVDEVKMFMDAFRSYEDVGYIVVSGSTPKGVTSDFFIQLSGYCFSNGIKLIGDTSGQMLKTMIQHGVYLIKPNFKELCELSGKDIKNVNEQVEAAQKILSDYSVHIIVVSLGASGAMLVSSNEVHHVGAPSVKRKSTVGAGDSMVAGMVYALVHGWPLQEVLKFGIACGSAATMNSGTQLCKKQDVELLYNWLKQQ